MDYFLLFFLDLVITMNIAAFVVALIDKARAGKLKRLFWFVTAFWGGIGSAAGCLLARHRTKSSIYIVITLAVVQVAVFLLVNRYLPGLM